MDIDARRKALDRLIGSCMEFADSIQIVATVCIGDSTYRIDAGRGNLYARRASVEQWLSELAFDGDEDDDEMAWKENQE